MLRIPIARLQLGLVPRWRRWGSCLQVGLRSWRICLQVSLPRLFVEPPNCFRVNQRSRVLRCPLIVVLFAVLFVDCEECLCILVGFLPGARRAIVCILFSLEQSRVVDWVIAQFLMCIYRENPQLRIFNSLSACSGVDVLLHGDSVVQHYVVFFQTCGWHWLSLIFLGIPTWKYRWMASVFFLSGLFKHLSRLVVHLLSFRRTVLVSTTAVFLDHLSRDCGDVTVVLVDFCWTPRRLHISSTAAVDHSHFPRVCSQEIAVRKKFRKVRRSRCCSNGRSSVVILWWTCWSSSSGSNPEWMNLYVCGSRTSQITFWLCSRVLHSASRLRKEVLQICCDPRCCYRFHRNFSNRSTVPKMILLPGFVDLVDHIASSNVARLVTFSESSEPSPLPCTSSIGPTVVKKTACLPLLRLVPPGINPFLIMEFNSFAFSTW